MTESAPEARGLEEIVRAGFEVFNRGAMDELMALAHPGIEVHSPEGLPNSGSFVGQAEYRAWVDRWMEAWEWFAIEIVRTERVGERHVVSSARQRAVGRGSGIEVAMEAFYVTEVRDGLFAALLLYPAHEEALAVARRREGLG